MPGWEETENEIRYRLKEPDLFEPESFRRTDFEGKLPVGIFYIRGKLESSGEWVTQALRFEKDKWTLEKAKQWYAEHKDQYKDEKRK